MYEYDSKFIYIDLKEAQDFFSLKGSVTGVEYKGDALHVVDVIDLRDKATCALLGTNGKELAGAWRYRKDRKTPPTQRLGRLATKLGVEGLIFQSTKGLGVCLVVFTANLRSSSFIEVSDGVEVLERMP